MIGVGRSGLQSTEAYEFGPFVLDTARVALFEGDREIELRPKAYETLLALLRQAGRVVSKDELVASVWPDVIVNDDALAQCVRDVRKAIADTDQRYIRTVSRRGYMFVHPLALGGSHARQPSAAPQPDGRKTVSPAIAVMPFANLSSDTEQEFVADGVVEDLITALSRFRTFAVVSRNSSFVYKGRAVDAREVARELGVRYLLEGSVRRSGDRLRVTAQLIEGATGEHLWAERFDGAATDMFDFQDTITETVIGLIEPRIRKAEIDRARQKRPETLDAWDLYVQASPLVYSGDVDNWSRSLDLLDRALALDPTYGPALSIAAWAHDKRHFSGGPGLPNYAADLDAAMKLVKRALAADPDDPFALVLYGWFHVRHKRDFSRGIEIVERAASLNPNNTSVLDLTIAAHLYAGDLGKVISLGTRILQLSPGAPLSYAVMTHIAAAHNAVGRHEEALDFARRVVELEPNYMYGRIHLAIAYAQLGRVDEARHEVAEALRIRPDANMAVTMTDRIRPPERTAIWVEGLRKAGMPE
jgi:TolB-like protein/Tfp pilus assembly protein PilF